MWQKLILQKIMLVKKRQYEVVKDSEDENEYEKETASEDEAIDADVINDLPEPEIVQAGNVRKSSSKVIGFIKK